MFTLAPAHHKPRFLNECNLFPTAGYEACVPRIVAVLDRLKQRDVTQVGSLNLCRWG